MNQVHGLLLINKSPGFTSHDVVAKVRRILGQKQVGHAGTLDPLASGVMVLLLGEATKISDYVLNANKAYEVIVRMGVETDTLDRMGQVLSTKAVDVNFEQINKAVISLDGVLDLPIPKHSAVKVNGDKLYDLARRGEDFVPPTRSMHFWDVRLVEQLDPSRIRVSMQCSKGSYVRAWVQRLGELLGTGASVDELVRTVSSPYTLEKCISLADLEQCYSKQDSSSLLRCGEAFVEIHDALGNYRALFIDPLDEKVLRNGQISKNLQARLLHFVSEGPEALPPVKALSRETRSLIAILSAPQGSFYKIGRVFHCH